jgi:hypothetical protein
MQSIQLPANQPADRFYRGGPAIAQFRGAGGASGRPPLRGDLVAKAGLGKSVLPTAMDEYFRLERRQVDGPATLEPGFGVLVVTDGAVTLEADPMLHLGRGATVVVPHSAGPARLDGRGEVLVCRPPQPGRS